ncbi:MAG: glycosyl transferase family protein [Candidatus Saccharibacteria bacterium]|nr:glycosyl transferase family protein [Candidatus Saccharibacteria bacterium]
MIIVIYSILTTLLGALLITFGIRLERALQQFRIKKQYTSAIEAPSVTVCVPARNETHAMTQCLERVLNSDYKKLEIIVFDDESADDTSVLINSFAHAGVRFVPGANLPEGWLGKNHALEVLAQEASGTYVLFLDVDTHIEPTTISRLVGYTMTENLEMVSVIPGRNDAWRPGVLFGHLRYYWELITSREYSPATSSSLWMIKRHTLIDIIGGFSPHKAEVEPEAHLAAIIGTKAYHCLVGSEDLGISYEKKWTSQCETSIRLSYPMVGGTKKMGAYGLLILTLLNLPTLLIISGLFVSWTPFHGLAVLYLVLFSLLYCRYTYVVWRRNWWLGAVVWPYAIAQELVLFIRSVRGYAKGTITWKGRPVTSPQQARLMHPAQYIK